MTDRQKVYLRKHDVPLILDNIVRQMLEDKPAKPFSYVVQQLKAVQEKAGGKPAEENKDKENTPKEEPIDLSKMTTDDQEKIIKIQAQYRGGKARNEVNTMKKDKPASSSDKENKKAETDLDTEGWSTEDKDKLVKIQARYRGGKGRKAAEEKKAAKPDEPTPKEGASDKPEESNKEEEKPAEGDKPEEKKEAAAEEKKIDDEKPAESTPVAEKKEGAAEEKKEDGPTEKKEEPSPEKKEENTEEKKEEAAPENEAKKEEQKKEEEEKKPEEAEKKE